MYYQQKYVEVKLQNLLNLKKLQTTTLYDGA